MRVQDIIRRPLITEKSTHQREGENVLAFEVDSLAALEAKRAELIAKGVKVTPVVDHEWMKSIYFKDPNGLQLEFCCYTRNLNADDALMQPRAEISVRRLGLEDPVALSSAKR